MGFWRGLHYYWRWGRAFCSFFSIHVRQFPRLVGFQDEVRERPSDLEDVILLLIHHGFSFYQGYFTGLSTGTGIGSGRRTRSSGVKRGKQISILIRRAVLRLVTAPGRTSASWSSLPACSILLCCGGSCLTRKEMANCGSNCDCYLASIQCIRTMQTRSRLIVSLNQERCELQVTNL
jgi:hypothetical protein